jgi:hypothetical protein
MPSQGMPDQEPATALEVKLVATSRVVPMVTSSVAPVVEPPSAPIVGMLVTPKRGGR